MRKRLSVFLTFICAFALANPEKTIKVDAECAALVRGFAALAPAQAETAANESPLASVRAMSAFSLDRVEAVKTTELTETEVKQALAALEKFFVEVYGENYTRELPPRTKDPLKNSLRSVMQLFKLSSGKIFPAEILLGISERGAERQKKLQKKIGEIRSLQQQLGDNVEYLTPDTLAALEIFQSIGSARSSMGSGGIRGALSNVSEEVRSNFDALLRSIGRAAVFDQTLRELLFVVIELTNNGKLSANNSRLKSAFHELLVANFTTGSPTLSEATLASIRHYGESSASRLNEPERVKLLAAIDALVFAQVKMHEPLREFVRSYPKAHISYNVISIMTRPNALAAVPLGHPFQNLIPELAEHPDVLNLALRAYGEKREGDTSYRYLSMRLGHMIESADSALKVFETQGDEAASKMLVGNFANDLRAADVLRRGWEFRLDQTIEILKEEKKARRLGIIAPIVGLVMGQASKKTGLQSEAFAKIGPQKLADYLVSQIETGGKHGPIEITNNSPVAGAATTPPVEELAGQNATQHPLRTRKIEKLPDTLPHFVIAGKFLTPWKERATPPAPPAEGAKEDSPFYVFLAENRYRLQMDLEVKEGAENKPNANVYFRSILRSLDSRALALLEHGDLKIQREKVESGKMSVEDIARLSNDVKELLEVFQFYVLSPFYECLTASGISFENAEETLAWYVLNFAPNLGMYLMIGPPGPPGIHPPIIPAVSGLSWRIGMLAIRHAYGDGNSDAPVYSPNGIVNPTTKSWLTRRRIGVSIAGGVVSLAMGYFGWMHWDDVIRFFNREPEKPAGVTAPADPAATDAPTAKDTNPNDDE